MDTSETYIKQSDCPEIQGLVRYKPAVLTFFDEGKKERPLRIGEDGSYFWGKKEIWLPRQDQLQEMVIPEDEKDCLNKYIVLLDDFQDWVLNDCTGLEWAHLHAVTMEQLWLAFVMKEKFNKTWNGDKWV